MFCITIAISLLIALAESKDDCWSEKYGYPCCKTDVKVKTVNDQGSWGIENKNWCGIVSKNEIKKKDSEEYCWANYIDNGYPCCTDDNGKVETLNMDGAWGFENGNWCGYRNSITRWNDREKFDDTKNEWNKFKGKWNEYSKNFERLSVFTGDNESMLNFGWYSTTNSEPVILFGTKEDMSDAKEFKGTNVYYKDMLGKKYYSNKVTVDGLEHNSVYYYKRKLNGSWEDSIIKFTTRDPNNFKFIFVGDPQIGGSHNRLSVVDRTKPLTVPEGTCNDAFNWNMTITNSFKLTEGPSLFMSAGDQADSECLELTEENIVNQEIQFNAFLLPELLKTVPMAACVGNHEATTENFRNHFNAPNALTTPNYSKVKDFKGVIPGYNYFFKHNNVLVVVLETNYSDCGDFKTVIANAIKKYPNTDWRIAMFHHDIYGNGYIHSREEYITEQLRPCLTEYFSKYKFDLVINGHDHVYTSSHFVSYDKNKVYSLDKIQTSKVYNDPKGTLYITANCATGSKLYTFASVLPDYVNYYNQTFSSTFGVLDFKKENDKVRLSIASYEVESFDITDGPYIFEKVSNSNSINNGDDGDIIDDIDDVDNEKKDSSSLKWIFILITFIVIVSACLYLYKNKLKRQNNDNLGKLFKVTSKTHLNRNMSSDDNIKLI